MGFLQKTVKGVCLSGVVVACAIGPQSCFPSDYVINITASMPIGIYRRTATTPKRGDMVGACVPPTFAALALSRGYLEPGTCPGGTRPVMKYVAAVEGDSVETLPRGVVINGEAVPNTRVFYADPHGRTLPRYLGAQVLQPGEYWLLSNRTAGSLDSRYFGPVTEILDVVEPQLTQKKLCRTEILKVFFNCKEEAQ